MPSGPARDPSGAVVVAEMTRHRIAHAAPGAGWTRFGARGNGVGHFERPAATALLSTGAILVLDTGNCRIVGIDDIAGTGWVTYGYRGRPSPADPAEGGFVDPRGIAVDTSDRIWVSDPGAGRVTRVDGIDGSGWSPIPLPAGVKPTIPYGICAYQDGVIVVDVGNSRLIRIDDNVTVTVDLDVGWLGPSFVTSLGVDIVVADITANELRLLEPSGVGFTETSRLRGSPPDLTVPLFDSLGGVGT
jgi:streptogramin lyase